MRRFFLIGTVLCLGAVIVPATTSGARTVKAAHAVRVLRAGGHKGRSRTSRTHAAAGSAVLTATPSTDLLDQQIIAVTASGLKARASYALIECQAGATDPTDCGLSDLVFATTDGAGSFSTPYTASRFLVLDGSGATIDCAVQSCVLVAGSMKGKLSVQTPISFQDIAVVPSTLTADPSTGLRDGQTITLSGAAFAPNAFIEVTECETTSPLTCDFNILTLVPADANGSFSLPFSATRLLDDGTGPQDCALLATCVVMAENGNNPSQTASAPLMFADVPLKTPKLTASPSTGLDDGDNVTVTGKGFKHHERIALTECVAGSTDAGECVAFAGIGNTQGVKADNSGHFSTSFNVARVLTLGGGTIDCAQAPGCVIGAIDATGFGTVRAVAPISFDPSVPPLPPLNLAVHVDPTGLIAPGGSKTDTVEITGTMSCDRSTPVPVELEMQVTEQVGSHEAAGFVTTTASCATGGLPFNVLLPSIRGHHLKSFAPGLGGLLMAEFAVSGSSSVNTTSSASITLLAPPAP
jgi:hypothetical protein